MNKEERRNMKERLQVLRVYLNLSQEAILYCQENEVISSKRWFRYYGLYCAGKDIQADVTELGKTLISKSENLKTSLGYGESLIKNSCLVIAADLNKEVTEEETTSRHM